MSEKEKDKRGSTKDFDGGIVTEQRKKNWANHPPCGKWRQKNFIYLRQLAHNI